MTSKVSHSNMTAEGRWLRDRPGESKRSEDKAEGTRLRDTQLRAVCFHSGKRWAGGRFCQKRESELLWDRGHGEGHWMCWSPRAWAPCPGGMISHCSHHTHCDTARGVGFLSMWWMNCGQLFLTAKPPREWRCSLCHLHSVCASWDREEPKIKCKH